MDQIMKSAEDRNEIVLEDTLCTADYLAEFVRRYRGRKVRRTLNKALRLVMEPAGYYVNCIKNRYGKFMKKRNCKDTSKYIFRNSKFQVDTENKAVVKQVPEDQLKVVSQVEESKDPVVQSPVLGEASEVDAS